VEALGKVFSSCRSALLKHEVAYVLGQLQVGVWREGHPLHLGQWLDEPALVFTGTIEDPSYHNDHYVYLLAYHHAAGPLSS
jgi:hypothetical protein